MRQMLVGDESANADVIFDKPIRADRLEALAKFLRKWVEYEDPVAFAGTRVTVYITEDSFIGGLRVDELAFKSADGKYINDVKPSMCRCVSEHASAILAAEMFLQTWGDKPYWTGDQGWEVYVNEHGVARLRLLGALGFHKSAGEDLADQRAEQAALKKETDNVQPVQPRV